MGGKFTYPKMGSQNGFDPEPHDQRSQQRSRLPRLLLLEAFKRFLPLAEISVPRKGKGMAGHVFLYPSRPALHFQPLASQPEFAPSERSKCVVLAETSSDACV